MQQDHMSTPQGSLEASSRQQLGVKSGSMESHGTIRNLISNGRAPEEGSSGQQLAARLQSSSFASEQVGFPRSSAAHSFLVSCCLQQCPLDCITVSDGVAHHNRQITQLFLAAHRRWLTWLDSELQRG